MRLFYVFLCTFYVFHSLNLPFHPILREILDPVFGHDFRGKGVILGRWKNEESSNIKTDFDFR